MKTSISVIVLAATLSLAGLPAFSQGEAATGAAGAGAGTGAGAGAGLGTGLGVGGGIGVATGVAVGAVVLGIAAVETGGGDAETTATTTQ